MEQVLLTVLGVMLAIPAGLGLDRIVTGIKKRADRTALLQAYYQAVQDNEEILRQLQGDVVPGSTAYYTLKFGQFEVLAAQAADLLGNLELYKQLTNYHYQLKLLGRKLDLHLQVNFGTVRTMMHLWKETNQQLAGSIQEHAALMRKDSKKLLGELSEALPNKQRLLLPKT